MKAPGMRGAFAKGHRKRQAMYLIPNFCTTGNLFCGVFSIFSVFNGEPFGRQPSQFSLR